MSGELTLFTRRDFQVEVYPEAVAQRDEAIAVAQLVPVVRDTKTRDAAVEAMRGLKTILKAAEDNRKALKDPVLQLGKRIDSTAQQFVVPVQAEYSRLDRALAEHEAEQREIARRIEEARQRELEAERRRLEEQARAAERERIRVEEAKRREIEEAKRKDAAEAARLQAIENDRLKAEEAKRAEEAKLAQEALEQKAAEMGPPVAPSTAEGQQVRQEYDYEVVDIHRLYLARGQQCVELQDKRAAIKALINSGGVREIPGVRIFEVTKNRISSIPQTKLIEV